MELNNIKKHLKESGINPSGLIRINTLLGTNSSKVYKIQNNQDFFILKIFNNKKDVLTVKKYYSVSLKNNISVPNVVNVDKNWILYKYIEGKLLCQLNTKEQRYNAAIKAGKLLRKIHNIKVKGFGWINTKNEWTGKTIRKNLNFFNKRIIGFTKVGCNPFSEKEKNRINKLTINHRDLLDYKIPCLLHGDYTGGNIILNKGKLFIIDPGEIIGGDPMADLGYTQTLPSPEYRKGILKGYLYDTLTLEEKKRFVRWRLLRQYVITCRACKLGNQNIKKYIKYTRQLLDEIEI